MYNITVLNEINLLCDETNNLENTTSFNIVIDIEKFIDKDIIIEIEKKILNLISDVFILVDHSKN